MEKRCVYINVCIVYAGCKTPLLTVRDNLCYMCDMLHWTIVKTYDHTLLVTIYDKLRLGFMS